MASFQINLNSNKIVGIVTHPLLWNYGGLLQNFALHQTLKKLGYKPITLNYVLPKLSIVKYFRFLLKTCLLFFTSRRRPFVRRKNIYSRLSSFDDFFKKYIAKTKPFCQYSVKLLNENNIGCVIVGSDQVWRPQRFPPVQDMYLAFCKKESNLKRIAYAASFGVDYWEYTSKQSEVCARLVKKFDAVSVREKSGIKLCKDHFDVDTTLVLDPTLLLNKEDYSAVCATIPNKSKKYLAAYILDMNDDIRNLCESIASEKKLIPVYFSSGQTATLTVPEWLAMFRDASYVVTDSFHGTVFSIIFGKEFKCLYNESRGSTRFDSLLKLYESGKLDEMREFSLNWLKNALEK